MGFEGLFGAITGLSGRPRGLRRSEIGGLVVSTVVTSDLGPETAVIDSVATYPVERYRSEKDALAGHERWCQAIEGGTRKVIKLGYPAGDGSMLVENMEVTLEER